MAGDAISNDVLNLTDLGLFWGAYLFVLIVLLVRPGTRFAALGFCLVATLLAPLIWPGQ